MITTINKACVILAGAGTGKSYTIKKKANYLINELKYDPQEILCLTFSNEAANSLRQDTQIEVKTFHGFCSDVLKNRGHLIGIEENFQVLLPDDAKIMMHKYLNISPYWSNRYISTISSAKDFGISLNDMKNYLKTLTKYEEDEVTKLKVELQTMYLEKTNRERKKEIQNILNEYDNYKKLNDFKNAWEDYDKLKKEKNYLDFSDLNYYTLKLFRDFGANKYQYIFIDEFQDTNKLQFELIEHIADQNITVVGDPNQSIYGFRGSYKESFEHFKKTFKVDKVFHLDKSYRSTNEILKVSNELIKNNYEDKNDCININNVNNIDGEKVKVIQTKNKFEEARVIANLVQEKINQGIKKEQICILHRTHKQAEEIKYALEQKNIAYISTGKTNLFQKREIRTTIAYLSILANLIERSSVGEQSWWDLFHFKNTLSPNDSIKIGRYIKKHKGISIDEILLNSIKNLSLSNEAKKIIKNIIKKLDLIIKSSNKPLPELILDIYEIIGLNREFSYKRTIENIESLMNLKKFYEIAQNFYEIHAKTIIEFIDYLEIVQELKVNIESSKINHIDAVNLMTIHASKGLEFDVVISTNLAKDKFPVTRTQNEPLIPKELLPDFKIMINNLKKQNLSQKEIDKKIKEYDKDILLIEERRLCYVAWTRAKNELYITYANSYNDQENSTKESIFLEEIDYKNITDFIEDNQEKSLLIAPNSKYEEYKSLLKEQLISSLDTEDYEDIEKRLLTYLVCKNKKIIKTDLLSIDEQKRHLNKCKENSSSFKFNPKEFTFSPTALIEYQECPKRFELSKIYQLPQRKDFKSDGSGATLGSFVHKVLEIGVNEKSKSINDYFEIAKKLKKEEEYKEINLDEVKPLIEVFWKRNKDKIKDSSKTELKLPMVINDFNFFGLADRIDFLNDGSIEIIDYKTNKNSISSDKRALQLGYYALALKDKGYKVSQLTLDMLRLDKPIVMEIVEDTVMAKVGCNKNSNFNLNDLKNKIIEISNNIKTDYEHSFECTQDQNNCRFCGYKFYCPKFDE